MKSSAHAPHRITRARFAARARLAAVALALTLIAGLGCRPRWSADGKRITFAALQGEAHVIAEYEVEAGRSKKLFDIELNDGAMDMVRDPDQPRWVIVWADAVDDAVVNVRTRDDEGVQSAPIAIRPGGRNITAIMTEPVVANGYVFVTANTVTRVDLETGETKSLDRPGLVAFPAAGGVGYAARHDGAWEIGRLDPKTLALVPQISRPAHSDWQIRGSPRFDCAGERCAVVVSAGDPRAGLDALKWAVLFFEGDALLTTIALEGQLAMGPIAWIDAVTIGATVMRPDAKEDRYELFETNINGSFRRTTPVLRAPVQPRLRREGITYQLMQPRLLQPSPSPDGTTIAFTTAKMPSLPADRAGLLLLRRDQKNRLERIPFGGADK